MKNYILKLLILFSLFVCGCSKNDQFNNKSFDISSEQDNSLIATTIKEGNSYKLIIEGKGDCLTYHNQSEVPYYKIASKIKTVEINEGIKNIGSYLFYSLNCSYYIIPNTVLRIESNSLNEGSICYCYSLMINNKTNNQTYYYSETPKAGGNYWHFVDNLPTPYPITNVLFVGNSFTYCPSDRFSEENPCIPYLFKELCTSLDINVSVDFVVKGGHSLPKYADSNDEKGKILEEKLKNNKYDYVILQDYSDEPIVSYNLFNEAVKKIKTKINKYQDNCKIHLYQTWSFEAYDGIINGKYNMDSMEMALRSAYSECASENNVKVNYVGKAFIEVYNNYKNINLYWPDLKHQSYEGSFLSALIHVQSIFNVDVRNANFSRNLDTNIDLELKEIAHNQL